MTCHDPSVRGGRPCRPVPPRPSSRSSRRTIPLRPGVDRRLLGCHHSDPRDRLATGIVMDEIRRSSHELQADRVGRRPGRESRARRRRNECEDGGRDCNRGCPGGALHVAPHRRSERVLHQWLRQREGLDQVTTRSVLMVVAAVVDGHVLLAVDHVCDRRSVGTRRLRSGAPERLAVRGVVRLEVAVVVSDEEQSAGRLVTPL